MNKSYKGTKFPIWFYIAILINGLSWIISWAQIKHIHFFIFIFLIGSYIFILDGINYKINKSSLFSRNKTAFLYTWLLSTLFWWYFEIIVMITKNWYYFTIVQYPLIITVPLATIYFSTVITGVIEIYEILNGLKVFKNPLKLKLPQISVPIVFCIGIISIFLTIWRPNYFFPFLWLSLFFILDPINYWLGNDSISKDVLKGKWGRVFRLGLSSLIFFIFWELWNFKNDPKWIYEVPYVDYFKVFEMPILGYSGYIPFGWEIFTFYSFFSGIFNYPLPKFTKMVDKTVRFTQKSFKEQRRIAFIITIFLIIISNVLLFTIKFRINSPENYSTPPIISNSTDESITLTGKSYMCNYSFWDNSCLETTQKQKYWLLDEKGNRVLLTTGKKYNLKGYIIEKVIGMDEFIITQVD